MSISAKEVRFDNDSMWVELTDGRTIGVPLAWFPRLLNASKEELKNFSLSPQGIHWESLDEDVSISGLLAGRGDQTKQGEVAA
ncbi:MAG: DUF2442 domain-containing protein [Granulosicoccus sp.]